MLHLTLTKIQLLNMLMVRSEKSLLTRPNSAALSGE